MRFDEKTPLEWSLIDRFLAGECSPEEDARIRAVFASRPTRRAELEAIRRVVRSTASEVTTTTSDAMWRGVSGRVAASPTQRKGLRLSPSLTWGTLAAAVALFALFVHVASPPSRRLNDVKSMMVHVSQIPAGHAHVDLSDRSGRHRASSKMKSRGLPADGRVTPQRVSSDDRVLIALALRNETAVDGASPASLRGSPENWGGN